jgi:hypothetical protein
MLLQQQQLHHIHQVQQQQLQEAHVSRLEAAASLAHFQAHQAAHHALHHAPQHVPPPPAAAPVLAAHARSHKVKQVLPCFNLICSGTCAYGPKCTFLHDPRAQLPKHLRKVAEYRLQSHLHTYRPNLSKIRQQQQQPSPLIAAAIAGAHGLIINHAEEDECSSCHTDSECSSNNGDHHPVGIMDGLGMTRTSSPSMMPIELKSMGHSHSQPTPSTSIKKDDIFAFPTMELTYLEPNSKCYDPTEDQIPSHSREMNMWYHFLSTVNEKYANTAIDVPAFSKQRLPVFERLARHHA